MATIVTRSGKGSALTFTEMDNNFTNLNTDKIELTSLSVGAEGVAAGDGGITYNNATGVFTYIPPTAAGIGAIALSALSVGTEGTPSGDGSLAYNNSTGVFTYTPPTLAGLGGIGLTALSVGAEASASGDGGIAYNNSTGVFTYTPPTFLGIGGLVADNSPSLGGNLDVEGYGITTTTTNQDLSLSANGTGKITINGGTGIDVKAANTITTTTSATDLILDATATVNFATGITETIHVSTTTQGTYAPAAANGSIHYVLLTGDMTINGFTDPVGGQSISLIMDNTDSAGGYTLTLGANFLTPGGSLSLTPGGYDLVTLTCIDDTTPTYIAVAINDFQ